MSMSEGMMLGFAVAAVLLLVYARSRNGKGPEAGCAGLVAAALAILCAMAVLLLWLLPHLRWVP